TCRKTIVNTDRAARSRHGSHDPGSVFQHGSIRHHVASRVSGFSSEHYGRPHESAHDEYGRMLCPFSHRECAGTSPHADRHHFDLSTPALCRDGRPKGSLVAWTEPPKARTVRLIYSQYGTSAQTIWLPGGN